MDSTLADMLPGSLQAYANFGMALVVIVVGVVGYYQKVRGEREKKAYAQLNDIGLIRPMKEVGERIGEMMVYLKSIAESTSLTSAGVTKIVANNEERARLEREEAIRQEGRDERDMADRRAIRDRLRKKAAAKRAGVPFNEDDD